MRRKGKRKWGRNSEVPQEGSLSLFTCVEGSEFQQAQGFSFRNDRFNGHPQVCTSAGLKYAGSEQVSGAVFARGRFENPAKGPRPLRYKKCGGSFLKSAIDWILWGERKGRWRWAGRLLIACKTGFKSVLRPFSSMHPRVRVLRGGKQKIPAYLPVARGFLRRQNRWHSMGSPFDRRRQHVDASLPFEILWSFFQEVLPGWTSHGPRSVLCLRIRLPYSHERDTLPLLERTGLVSKAGPGFSASGGSQTVGRGELEPFRPNHNAFGRGHKVCFPGLVCVGGRRSNVFPSRLFCLCRSLRPRADGMAICRRFAQNPRKGAPPPFLFATAPCFAQNRFCTKLPVATFSSGRRGES